MSLFHGLLVAALLVSGVAAVFDWRRSCIPNWLTLGGIALGLTARGVAGLALYDFDGALRLLAVGAVGMIACSILPLLMRRFNAMGGGDVKLLAAVGAWCGPTVGIQITYYAFGILLFYATARLTYQGKLFRTLGNALCVLCRPLLKSERQRPIPEEVLTQLCFGPAAFAGVLLAFLVYSVTI